MTSTPAPSGQAHYPGFPVPGYNAGYDVLGGGFKVDATPLYTRHIAHLPSQPKPPGYVDPQLMEELYSEQAKRASPGYAQEGQYGAVYHHMLSGSPDASSKPQPILLMPMYLSADGTLQPVAPATPGPTTPGPTVTSYHSSPDSHHNLHPANRSRSPTEPHINPRSSSPSGSPQAAYHAYYHKMGGSQHGTYSSLGRGSSGGGGKPGSPRTGSTILHGSGASGGGGTSGTPTGWQGWRGPAEGPSPPPWGAGPGVRQSWERRMREVAAAHAQIQHSSGGSLSAGQGPSHADLDGAVSSPSPGGSGAGASLQQQHQPEGLPGIPKHRQPLVPPPPPAPPAPKYVLVTGAELAAQRQVTQVQPGLTGGTGAGDTAGGVHAPRAASPPRAGQDPGAVTHPGITPGGHTLVTVTPGAPPAATAPAPPSAGQVEQSSSAQQAKAELEGRARPPPGGDSPVKGLQQAEQRSQDRAGAVPAPGAGASTTAGVGVPQASAQQPRPQQGIDSKEALPKASTTQQPAMQDVLTSTPPGAPGSSAPQAQSSPVAPSQAQAGKTRDDSFSFSPPQPTTPQPAVPSSSSHASPSPPTAPVAGPTPPASPSTSVAGATLSLQQPTPPAATAVAQGSPATATHHQPATGGAPTVATQPASSQQLPLAAGSSVLKTPVPATSGSTYVSQAAMPATPSQQLHVATSNNSTPPSFPAPELVPSITSPTTAPSAAAAWHQQQPQQPTGGGQFPASSGAVLQGPGGYGYHQGGHDSVNRGSRGSTSSLRSSGGGVGAKYPRGSRDGPPAWARTHAYPPGTTLEQVQQDLRARAAAAGLLSLQAGSGKWEPHHHHQHQHAPPGGTAELMQQQGGPGMVVMVPVMMSSTHSQHQHPQAPGTPPAHQMPPSTSSPVSQPQQATGTTSSYDQSPSAVTARSAQHSRPSTAEAEVMLRQAGRAPSASYGSTAGLAVPPGAPVPAGTAVQHPAHQNTQAVTLPLTPPSPALLYSRQNGQGAGADSPGTATPHAGAGSTASTHAGVVPLHGALSTWESSGPLEEMPAYTRYSNVFSKGEIGGNILHPEFNKPNPRSKQGSGWGGAHASHSPRASLASVRSSLTSVTSSRVPSRASKAKPKYLTDNEYEDRLVKRQLWAARSGLSEDVRVSQSAARFARAENRRLAGEASALARSLDSLKDGKGSPKVVAEQAQALQARLAWLEQYMPLTSDGLLEGYTFHDVSDVLHAIAHGELHGPIASDQMTHAHAAAAAHQGYGSDEVPMSGEQAILRLLAAIKGEHQHQHSMPSAQGQTTLVQPTHAYAAGTAAHAAHVRNPHLQDPFGYLATYRDQLRQQMAAEKAGEASKGSPVSDPSTHAAEQAPNSNPSFIGTGRAVTPPGAAAAATSGGAATVPRTTFQQAAAIPTGTSPGAGPAGVAPGSGAAAEAHAARSAEGAATSKTAGVSEAAKQEVKPSRPRIADASDSDTEESDDDGSSTPGKEAGRSASSKGSPGTAQSSKPAQTPSSPQPSSTAGCIGPSPSTATATSLPLASGSKGSWSPEAAAAAEATLAQKLSDAANRLGPKDKSPAEVALQTLKEQTVPLVPLVVPYSTLPRMERMDAALTQLLQPPSTGPVASIFTAAHRPVPAFESGACERTLIRKGWGTGAKGEARSKLLRDAEAVMEEREAEERDKEEALEEGEEQGLTAQQVEEELAEETRAEDKALALSAARASKDRAQAEADAEWRHAHAPAEVRRRRERKDVLQFRAAQEAEEKEDGTGQKEGDGEKEDDGSDGDVEDSRSSNTATQQKPASSQQEGGGGEVKVAPRFMQQQQQGEVVLAEVTLSPTSSPSKQAAANLLTAAQPAPTPQVQGGGSKQLPSPPQHGHHPHTPPSSTTTTTNPVSQSRAHVSTAMPNAGVASPPDYGTYTRVTPLPGYHTPGPGVVDSPTAQRLSQGRTVRDRLLLLEHQAHMLKAKGLWHVAPAAWQGADKVLQERAAILEDIAQDDRDERAAQEEAHEQMAREADQEAAASDAAVQRLRREAAAATRAIADDDGDDGSKAGEHTKPKADGSSGQAISAGRGGTSRGSTSGTATEEQQDGQHRASVSGHAGPRAIVDSDGPGKSAKAGKGRVEGDAEENNGAGPGGEDQSKGRLLQKRTSMRAPLMADEDKD